MPVNDLEGHEFSTTCKCSPQIEKLEDGEIMVIHNSYDGREHQEELLTQYSKN